MNRRGFLGSILALGAAPAVVKASSLMKLAVAKPEFTWAQMPIEIIANPEGITDTSQAMIDLICARMKVASRVMAESMTSDLYRPTSRLHSQGGYVIDHIR